MGGEVGELPARCDLCGNYVDSEDLFCGSCGREVSPKDRATDGGHAASVVEEGFVGFQCESCGASLTYDAERQGLRCAFCGSVSLKRQEAATGRIRPAYVLRFDVVEDDARSKFRAWIGKGFFRPFGIASRAKLVAMQAVYVPFWRFRADTHTYYTGDTSRTPPFARADWCPVFGERRSSVEDVLVAASGSLLPGEVASIEPFDFSRREPYERDALREHAVEDFGLGRRGARDPARGRMVEVERAACAAEIPGRSRNVHVNTLFTNMRSEPVLLPVWINAYRYKEQTYRFLVNGQTGRVCGSAPFSWVKLALVILAVLLLAAVLFAAFGVFAG